MRLLAATRIVFVAMNVARADALFKVGVTERDFIPAERYDWRGANTHALRATVRYPAAADPREERQWIGPPFFRSSAPRAMRRPPRGARRMHDQRKAADRITSARFSRCSRRAAYFRLRKDCGSAMNRRRGRLADTPALERDEASGLQRLSFLPIYSLEALRTDRQHRRPGRLP